MRKVLAAVLFLLGGAAASAEEIKPIRDFEIATIERLGQAIYRQDQLAWKATDILLAQHSPSELRRAKARGWIVDEGSGGHVVRFLREGANGPEVAYDVTFSPGAPGVLSEPENRTLTSDELSQHRARMLAAENFDFHCTADPANTVALHDSQGKGWLVWVMSATNDTDKMVMAGHIRFLISDDGRTLLQKDKLSRGCMVTDRPKERNGDKPVGQLFTNVISLKPVETQVFATLSYAMPMYVGTKGGVIWKIDSGHISVVEEDAPDVDGASARMIAGLDEICSPIFQLTEPGKKGFVLGETMQVISQLEHKNTLSITVPSDKRLSAVMCLRNSIIPSPNDYRLMVSRINLFIADKGEGHPKRRGELVVKAGKLEFNMNEGGSLTEAENAKLQKRLQGMQSAYDRAAPK